MITEQDLQIPRSPSALRTFVSDTLEAIATDKSAAASVRLLEGAYKYLVREVYPLSVFCAWQYPADDVLVAPCIGNQGYDAEIQHLSSNAVTRVEICWPIDGKQEKKTAREVNNDGRSSIHVGHPNNDLGIVAERLFENLRKKAQKDYSDAVLLAVLNLWPCFFLDDPTHRASFNAVIANARTIHFNALGAFLMLWPPEYAQRMSIDAIIEI